MTRHRSIIRRCLFFAIFATFCSNSFPPVDAAEAQLREFVTRRGDQLFEGDRPFRFISVNIPNLQIVEDNFAEGAETAWGWPNEFELNDALESVRQIGGTVARSYVLSVRREGSDMGDHVYVRGPGEFNEEAFRTLDLAIEIANRKGVRLIVPLVDNWKWHGGVGEYADFRGKQPEEFWTDEQLIADFEETVRYVLTRINSRTGVAYRDDPAILGWETGNELDSPPEWTRRIAALIKKLDPNHLVIDGNSLHGVHESSLEDPNVDLVTTHHYPNTDKDYVKAILAGRERSRGKKPYFVGEFGFVPADEIKRVYDAVIESGVSGALLWSLRYHHRDGGFYWHFEPLGDQLYKAYHWPGFKTGAPYDEQQVMALTRAKAFEIRGMTPPPIEVPAPPRLLPIHDVAAISWQGSAGAERYDVERAPRKSGPWSTAGEDIDDTLVQYRPLFNDESAKSGEAWFYRVRAKNSAGASNASNIVGPVLVAHRTLVDEGADLSRVEEVSAGVKPTTGDDRRSREDIHRLLIPDGGAITYRMPAAIRSWEAIVFREGPAEVSVAYSVDGVNFTEAPAAVSSGRTDAGDYGYLEMLTLRSESAPPAAKFLRLQSSGGPVELSRVEIRYRD